jgi:hypothetical protein
VASQLTSPASQQLYHPSRHDPLYTKKTEDQDPQFSHHFTVDNKMIYGLSTPLAHATPIYQYDVPFIRLSKVKIFLSSAVYTKNATLEGNGEQVGVQSA